MVLAAAQYLDDETILKHLPFLNIDEIDNILLRRDKEEADRYAEMEKQIEELQNDENDAEGQSQSADGNEAE